MSNTFKGFPQGKFSTLQLPPAFLAQVLPAIDDLAELKVTLFCFWALAQRPSTHAPLLRWQHFRADADLMAGITHSKREADEALRDALARAVARGTLLCATLTVHETEETLYLVNTPKGRKLHAQLIKGNWRPSDDELLIEILPERPNIYTLYEQNIGVLTAHISEALRDAEREYPAEWIEDAIRESVISNKRSWRYARAILDRWKQEGRVHHGTTQKHSLEDGKRFTSGKYADFIES